MADSREAVNMAKAKCFAMKERKCQVLTGGRTRCDKCSIYRTPAELAESQKTASVRLAELSGDDQAYISSKYYNGEMPWLEAGNK